MIASNPFFFYGVKMTVYQHASRSLFPFINYINELAPFVSHKQEIRFTQRNNGYAFFTVGCYMISQEDTFDSVHTNECRGITFNEKGIIVSRPLHKFFNVNERPNTRFEENEWGDVTRVMDKVDGSMITTVFTGQGNSPFENQSFDIKSKKSFDSPVCINARSFIQEHKNIQNLCNLFAKTHTLIFEYTSPHNRIVVSYPEAKLTLLHVRNNVTGVYLSRVELEHITKEYGVDLVEDNDTMLSEIHNTNNIQNYLLDKVNTTEGIEGWVFQLRSGDMFKLKTKWYMDRHHIFTALRVRDIAKMVTGEVVDDLKSKLVSDGIDISEILDIEQSVVSRINGIQQAVTDLYEANKHLDRKSLALSLKSHVYFGMVMSLYSSKEVDYKEFFVKNYLNEEYPLQSLKLNEYIVINVGEE